MTTPTDIIRQAISSQICNIHTCLPAKIVSYDYTVQKATVQPLLSRRYKNGTEEGDIQPIPEITNVPVIFPRSTGFSMHYPLNEGDNVMILFSERSMDEWLDVGGKLAPLDPRKFDLSDAIAIPGLYPFSDSSPAEDNTTYTVQVGSAKLKIDPSGTFCFHGITEELMDILDSLFSLIEAITVIVPPGTLPPAPFPIANIASFVDLQTRFNTLKGTC